MKKNVILFLMILCQSVAMAQYNVGSSITKQTDMFGNTTTVHKDHYGNTTGTSTTQKTDIFGNTTTQHKSNNINTKTWSW